MKIQGWLYSDSSSQRHVAILEYCTDGNIKIQLAGEFIPNINCTVEELEISKRIGNTARFISLPSHAKFETEHNNEVDALIAAASVKGQVKQHSFSTLTHRVESSALFVVMIMSLLVVSSWLFIQHGIPYFSNEIAAALPEDIGAQIGQGSLEILDESIMQTSELLPTRKALLKLEFEQLVPDDYGRSITLIFRKSDIVGANAFALPSDTVLFTDELVQLATSDEELKTIMLHEIAHIVHRHSLRRLIQQSGLALLVVLITGDISTTSSMIIALPAMLFESKYSQEMETEADSFALNHLTEHRINPIHFANIMTRMEQSHDSVNLENDISTNDSNTRKSIQHYFSSHPATETRIQRFRDATLN